MQKNYKLRVFNKTLGIRQYWNLNTFEELSAKFFLTIHDLAAGRIISPVESFESREGFAEECQHDLPGGRKIVFPIRGTRIVMFKEK